MCKEKKEQHNKELECRGAEMHYLKNMVEVVDGLLVLVPYGTVQAHSSRGSEWLLLL